MTPEVLILARDPAFGEALRRLLDLALEVPSTSTTSEIEAEDVLAETTPVLVLESEARPADFAFLLRAWRLRPEAPVIVCCPPGQTDAHRAFGPLATLTNPTPPGPVVRAVRRALLSRPWVQDTVGPPLGLPAVLPVFMAPVDVMHALRRDPLTFNLWREATNPGFHRAGWLGNTADIPQATYSLARAFLPRADLSRANFTRLSLYGASLREVSGAFVQFEGADLRDADLSGSLLVGSDLSEADLRGASLEHAELVGCDLRGALLDPAALEAATLVDCELDVQKQKASPPQTA